MLKTALKLIIAIAFIWYLIAGGKLDFSLLGKAVSSETWWWLALILMTAQAAVSSIRWKWLLETGSSKKLPYFPLIKLTWIGLFFSSVLPGAVTGDLIKLVYARDLDSSLSKTFLVMSALVDRILGLIGLILLTGIFTLLNISELRALSPKMEAVIHFNGILFMGAMAFLASLFAPVKFQNLILKYTNMIPILGHRVAKTASEIWVMGANKKAILKALGLSLVLQFNNVFCFWLLTMPFYGKELPLDLAFSFIPIGLISVAIPVSPGGLGVGHMIFDALFGYVGVAKGASLFNIFYFAQLFENLLGFIPYVLSGKKHTLKEAESFESV